MSSSARRAITVLQALSASDVPLGVTAIAAKTGSVAGTAFRSLDALERGGFVTRYQSSSQYQLGETAARLKHALYSQFALRRLCLPFLHRLAFATSESCSLVVPVGWYAVRIAVVRGTSFVRSSVHTGIVGLVDEHPAGEALLAFAPDADLERFCAFASEERGRPASASDYLLRLGHIRRQGYATEESESGSALVAFPVSHGNRAAAAIVIEGAVESKVADEGTGHDGCLAMVREMEGALAKAATTPDELNPFHHIDPASIRFPQLR